MRVRCVSGRTLQGAPQTINNHAAHVFEGQGLVHTGPEDVFTNHSSTEAGLFLRAKARILMFSLLF